MSEINKENVGGLIISEDVIAEIAKNASKDIEGLAGFAARPADITGVFKKTSSSKSIKVTSHDNEMVLDMHVILKSGVKIPIVCEKIQRNVKEAVQNMTGRIVNKVNISVAGIEFLKEERPEPQE